MQLKEIREKACLSEWFQLLENAGLPVPKTEVIKTDVRLVQLFDSKTPSGYKQFIQSLKDAAEIIGYPCFLRTGQTSNKHGWKNTCFIESPKDFESHVFNLIEFSVCVDLFGLPYNVWVVRELLPTKPIFYHWDWLPITKERRYFAESGKVRCHHPYWYEGVFEGLRYEQETHLKQLNFETGEEIAELTALAEKASSVLEGAWSIDFLETEKGWYLIDAAPAEGSWHYPGCLAAPEL